MSVSPILLQSELSAVKDRLKSMANEKRLMILFLLMDGERRTVNTIAREIGIAQSTASEQLKLIREKAGFIVAHKEGKHVYYSTDNSTIIGFLDRLRNHLNACCPEDPR